MVKDLLHARILKQGRQPAGATTADTNYSHTNAFSEELARPEPIAAPVQTGCFDVPGNARGRSEGPRKFIRKITAQNLDCVWGTHQDVSRVEVAMSAASHSAASSQRTTGTQARH